jgi:hypothetical protein
MSFVGASLEHINVADSILAWLSWLHHATATTKHTRYPPGGIQQRLTCQALHLSLSHAMAISIARNPTLALQHGNLNGRARR